MPKNLLEPDFQEPFAAWQQEPSPTNTGAMLRAVDPVINSAMRAYAGPSAKSVNLKAQAKMMAAEALSSYDPAKGPLKSHLMARLQRIRRVASQQRQVIRVPEQVALDQMQSEAAGKELEERLGRPPSDQELADFTGLSVKRLEYIRGSGRPLAESTITRPGEEGSGMYDPRVRQIQQDDDAWLELVYDDLDQTNQFIMERVLGMHGHEQTKPRQVAAMLKISPAAVSQRMAQIQQKVDQREALGML
jgi:DNA-directed RNA polymerase specialized sigma subunit